MHVVDPDTTQPTLYTIGHSNRSLDELIELLMRFSIRQLIDIRTQPDNSTPAIFNRQTLQMACADEAIAYTWQGIEFRGRQHPKPDSPNIALNSERRSFADHMANPQFQQGIQLTCQLARNNRVALMCAEREPRQCHRHMIADYLVLNRWQVIHIIDSNNSFSHQVNQLARLQDQSPVYDRLSQEQLDFHF